MIALTNEAQQAISNILEDGREAIVRYEKGRVVVFKNIRETEYKQPLPAGPERFRKVELNIWPT